MILQYVRNDKIKLALLSMYFKHLT